MRHPRRLIAMAGICLSAVLLGGTTIAANAAPAAGSAPASSAHAPSSAASKSVSGGAWTHTLCQSLSKWLTKLHSLSDGLSSQVERAGSVADTRKLLTQFLQKVVDSTGQLIQQVDGAGTPKVDQGKAVARFFHDGLSQLKDVYSKARRAAQKLPNDPQAFAANAQSLGSQIESGGMKVGALFADAHNRFNAPEIETALRTDPACASIRS